MRSFTKAAAVAAAGLISAGTANAADVVLSSPNNLSAVSIGQTVTINVSLANLNGDTYSTLLVPAAAPNALFAAAGDPTAGAIVPSSDDFFGVADDMGDPSILFEDGAFESTGGDVTAPGVLFSFQVTADTAGSGFFTFSEAPSGFLSDRTTEATLTPGGPLAVTVVVPEPATAGSLLAAAGLGLLRRRRNGR